MKLVRLPPDTTRRNVPMLKLTPAFIALLLTHAALAAPDPAETKTTSVSRGLMRYDTNKDGFVDRTEWKAGQEERFRQLDTDRDGKLSRDELFARTPSTGGSVIPAETQLRRQDTYFRLLDTNKDGFVSKEEFLAVATRNFERCDLDKDGRITTAECREALRRRPTDQANRTR
jgi:Ca2+-binding EF-hand superfamily protein